MIQRVVFEKFSVATDVGVTRRPTLAAVFVTGSSGGCRKSTAAGTNAANRLGIIWFSCRCPRCGDPSAGPVSEAMSGPLSAVPSVRATRQRAGQEKDRQEGLSQSCPSRRNAAHSEQEAPWAPRLRPPSAQAREGEKPAPSARGRPSAQAPA